jgi:hypothetical protein
MRTLLAALLLLLVAPLASAQSINEALTECPATLTGSSQPEQIHLQLTDSHDEMMVMWATEVRGNAEVEWTSSAGETSASGESYCYNHDKAFHMALMTGLPLGEEITYRVGDGSTWSPELSFTTIDPDAEHFEWISIADHGMSEEGQQVSDGIISDQNAQLVTISGDISYADGDQNVWDDWFDIQQSSMVSIPWVPTVGNHENEPGPGFTPYEHRFDSDEMKESEEFWYARNMPGVHMVFISSEHPYDEGSAQYNWIKADIEAANSEQAREERPFIIIYSHKPMYSSNSYHGSEVELRDALEALYVENGVDLIVAGHDHFYERTHPVIAEQVVGNGPVHLVIGMGGRAAYEELDEPQPEWSAFRENSSYGWTRLVYDGESRTIDFTHHRIDGSIGDSFTLHEGGEMVLPEVNDSLGIAGINAVLTLTALLGAALFTDR